MKDQIKVELKNKDQRGIGFPQILHDRSRDTGNQLFKLLISLSTATLAIYFFALTGEAKPPLTLMQKIIALMALFSMAMAVFGGIVSMHSDSRRNYYWACALQCKEKDKRRGHYKRRDFWVRLEYRTYHILSICFCFGILCSLAYMVSRILTTYNS